MKTLALLEEKNRIIKLMNLTLINETINPIKWLEQVPALKEFVEQLEKSKLYDDFSKNLDKYSQSLRSQGVKTGDDLLRIAREWQSTQKNLKNLVDEESLIDRYLRVSGVIDELEEGIIRNTIKEIDDLTINAVGKLRDVVDDIASTSPSISRITDDQIDDIQTNITIQNGDETVDGLSKLSTDLKIQTDAVDELTNQIDDQITEIRARSQGQTMPQADKDLISDLTSYRTALNDLKTAISVQKKSIDNTIKFKSKDQGKGEIEFLGTKGVAGDAKINIVNKFLYNLNVDQLNVFITRVVKFIVMVVKGKSRTEAILDILARMRDLEIRMRDFDPETFKSEMQLLEKDLRIAIDIATGKKLSLTTTGNQEGWFKSFLKKMWGEGDVTDTWKYIVSVIDDQVKKGVITAEEGKNILQRILNVYSVTEKGKVVNPDDMNFWSGLFKFREDLNRVASERKIELGTTVDSAVKTSSDESELFVDKYIKGWVKKAWVEISGLSPDGTMKGLFKTLGRASVRWFLFGLPLNIRSYLRPIFRYGLNLKSTVMILCRLSLSHLFGQVVFGFGNFLLSSGVMSVYAMFNDDGLTTQQRVSQYWKTYTSSFDEYENMDILSILNLEFNTSNKMAKSEITGREYIETANQQYGPIKLTWLEIIIEMKSQFFDRLPTQEELLAYELKQFQLAKERMKKTAEENIDPELKKREENLLSNTKMSTKYDNFGSMFYTASYNPIMNSKLEDKADRIKWFKAILSGNNGIMKVIYAKGGSFNTEKWKFIIELKKGTFTFQRDGLNEVPYATGPNNKKYYNDKPSEMYELVNHMYDLNAEDPIDINIIENNLKAMLDTIQKNSQPKNTGINGESVISITNKILKEMSEGKKFGEDNFKHWKDTFKFKKHDEKTGQLKDVKITAKMDEIMDRIDHFRKKYDEDDSFVRAVIDVFGTGIDVIQYTKGLVHLTEGVIVGGLLGVLANIRESKELVTWTVKHYKDGNWELVKGNFNKQELLNVGKTKRERDERQKELENPAEGLKKKELESIMVLKRDEKEGIHGLPTKVKEKIKEKLRQGWTTETPFEFLSQFYTESEINSVFNEKIKIYKLNPSLEFFRTLAKNSSKINLNKGFCKSLKKTKVKYEMSQRETNVLQNFISKCEIKFGD